MTATGAPAGADAAALRLQLSVAPGATLSRRQLPLQLCFENAGDAPLRLLLQFEPVPVFFSFHLLDARGQELDIPGGGKADFFQGSLRYAELPPGGRLATGIDLAALLARPEQMQPGPYTAWVEYHNQYGEGCFRGRVASPPIVLVVAG